jgi:hypothetical protein
VSPHDEVFGRIWRIGVVHVSRVGIGRHLSPSGPGWGVALRSRRQFLRS